MSPTYEGHPDQRFGPTTYAQRGEDLMILNLFEQMGLFRPSYLDLGAHHPFTISNTALLYERGSRGINVEANPDLIEEFKKQRSEDVNVCVGVGPESGVLPFYRFSLTSGRNTFDPQEVKRLEGVLKVQETIQVPMITLPELISEHWKGSYPDLLTCDLEGLDYRVLEFLPKLEPKQIPTAGPKLIVVEVRPFEVGKMNRLLNEKGYFYYCMMGENMFFIRNDYKGKYFNEYERVF